MRGNRPECGTLSAVTLAQPPLLRLAPADDPRPWTILAAITTYAEDMGIAGNHPNYIASERDDLKRHAERANWHAPSDMTPDSCRAWMLDLATTVGGKTRKNYRDTAMRFAEWCLKRGLLGDHKTGPKIGTPVTENPFAGLPVPRFVKGKPRIIPTDAELVRIIVAAAAQHRAKALWAAFLAQSTIGLRATECKFLPAALVPDDYDERNWMDLSPDLTKEKRWERVYFTRETHRMALAFKQDAARCGRVRLFNTGMKRSQVKTYARHGFVEAVRASQTLSYHSLRHYTSERLGQFGFDMDEAQWAMRHVPQNITATVYDFSLHRAVSEKFRAIPALLDEAQLMTAIGFINERRAALKKGPKIRLDRLTERPCFADTVGVTPSATIPHDRSSLSCPGSGCHSPKLGGAGTIGRDQGVAQLGRAAGLGPAGRLFESGHPDFQPPLATTPTATRPLVQIHRPTRDGEPASNTDIQDGPQAAHTGSVAPHALARPGHAQPRRRAGDLAGVAAWSAVASPATPVSLVGRAWCQTASTPGCEPGSPGSIPGALIDAGSPKPIPAALAPSGSRDARDQMGCAPAAPASDLFLDRLTPHPANDKGDDDASDRDDTGGTPRLVQEAGTGVRGSGGYAAGVGVDGVGPRQARRDPGALSDHAGEPVALCGPPGLRPEDARLHRGVQLAPPPAKPGKTKTNTTGGGSDTRPGSRGRGGNAAPESGLPVEPRGGQPVRDGAVGLDDARSRPAPALRPDGADGRLNDGAAAGTAPGVADRDTDRAPAATPDAIARAYANTSELSPTDRLKLLRLLIELGGDYLAPVLLAALIAGAVAYGGYTLVRHALRGAPVPVQVAGPDEVVP